MDAASVAAAQKVRGLRFQAEPETGTSTSPQLALAHLSFWPGLLGAQSAEDGRKIVLVRKSANQRLPGILLMDHLKQINFRRSGFVHHPLRSPVTHRTDRPFVASCSECTQLSCASGRRRSRRQSETPTHANLTQVGNLVYRSRDISSRRSEPENSPTRPIRRTWITE